jgi:transposase
MNITTIGLDIAKNIFQVHGVDRNGKAVLHKQLKRNQVLAYLELIHNNITLIFP